MNTDIVRTRQQRPEVIQRVPLCFLLHACEQQRKQEREDDSLHQFATSGLPHQPIAFGLIRNDGDSRRVSSVSQIPCGTFACGREICFSVLQLARAS